MHCILVFWIYIYIYENLWLFEVERVYVVCCEVWIALIYAEHHVDSCTQVLKELDAIILGSLWKYTNRANNFDFFNGSYTLSLISSYYQINSEALNIATK